MARISVVIVFIAHRRRSSNPAFSLSKKQMYTDSHSYLDTLTPEPVRLKSIGPPLKSAPRYNDFLMMLALNNRSAGLRKLSWLAMVWAVYLCWAGRYEMLDDALIHLRYASVLHNLHIISYDGIHLSYGTSSLLYVWILAILRSFTYSPLLPKAVSLLAYVGLLSLVYRSARINRFAYALFFVLVSPFAIRWLTDGMETGLACLLAVALAFLLFRKASPFVLALIALALSLLRVDLTLLVAFAVVLMVSQGEKVRAIALSIGSGLSLLFTQLTMGHLLPDTALAKQGLRFFDVLGVMAYELAATFSCGLGLLLLWVVSAVVAWRVNRKSALIANMLFPVFAILAAARGQQIHGIRYMVWALLFSIVWNMLIGAEASQPRPAHLIAFACLLATCWVYELPIVLRIDRGRAADLVLWKMQISIVSMVRVSLRMWDTSDISRPRRSAI